MVLFEKPFPNIERDGHVASLVRDIVERGPRSALKCAINH
jgi:hypothetical protein